MVLSLITGFLYAYIISCFSRDQKIAGLIVGQFSVRGSDIVAGPFSILSVAHLVTNCFTDS